jgi:uncharacterized FlgJ-related protein
MKRVSMSKSLAESLVDRKLRNFKKYHLRQKSQVYFRILNDIIQETENKVVDVHRLLFTNQ